MERERFFRIAKRLEGERGGEDKRGERQAVVLVVYFPEKGSFLMIRRARHESDLHSGQLSFPGGMREEEDGGIPENTGLREAWEEVGLPRESVSVCGVMSPFVTGTGFSIVPVLGVSEGEVSWQIDKDEVEEVMLVEWGLFCGQGSSLVHEGHGVRSWKGMPAYWVEKGLVWGASARIMSWIVWADSELDKKMKKDQ